MKPITPKVAKAKPKSIGRYETIRVVAHIDADGDVYVKDKKGTFRYIGFLGDEDCLIHRVPNAFYKQAKKIIK